MPDNFTELKAASFVYALENCRLFEGLPQDELKEIASFTVVQTLEKGDYLSLRMLSSMALHLRDLVSQIEDLTLRDVETRLANWLIKRCPDPESDEPFQFDLTTTKQVLAAELGTISATLSRTLAHLREQNLLEVDHKSMTVVSPAKLRELLRQRFGD